MITSFSSPPDPQLFAGLVLIETRPKLLADSVHDKPDRAKRVDAINLGRREGGALNLERDAPPFIYESPA